MNAINFSDYGGRGIKVCARWLDFRNFLADMGERPDGHQIDRIDVNGDYEPGNCRWATASQNSNNRRQSKKYRLNDRLLTVAEIASVTGIKPVTIRQRLRNGWNVCEAACRVPEQRYLRKEVRND